MIESLLGFSYPAFFSKMIDKIATKCILLRWQMGQWWSSRRSYFKVTKRNSCSNEIWWNYMVRRHGKLTFWLWKTIYLYATQLHVHHLLLPPCEWLGIEQSVLKWTMSWADLLLNADVIWLTGEYTDWEQNSAAGSRSRGTSEHCDFTAEHWSWCKNTGWGWRLRVSLRRFRVRFRLMFTTDSSHTNQVYLCAYINLPNNVGLLPHYSNYWIMASPWYF